MRVAWQAGVIRALLEEGLTFVHGDGTSGGTINLAMLLSGLSPDDMCARWRTLRVGDFVSLAPWADYLRAHDMPAWGDADGIVRKVFPHLGVDVDRIRAAQGMTGTFNVCDFRNKTAVAIPNDRVDMDVLVAGISLPIFMPPVASGDHLYLDAVWIRDSNCLEAVRRGADELWLVWCIGNTPTYRGGAFNQYVHMIELSAHGALFEEFDRIAEINQRISAGETVHGHTRPIVLHVIKPEYPLPLDPDLYFGRITTDTLVDMGYADASAYLRRRTPAGLPFLPETMSMSDTKLGVTFRETMAGGLTLGETDPAAGEQRGMRAGTILAMHATIEIGDLDRFMSDVDHTGRITAHIDYPPFGDDIPAQSGVFNLFKPSGSPGMSLMVYGLAFRHDGKQYYLAGKKELRDDPGLDLWPDTTTLFTHLHEGTDSTGPVVGAGILRIGVADLIKLVRSMSATGADSLSDKTKALSTFGKFFMGSLWTTYGRWAAK